MHGGGQISGLVLQRRIHHAHIDLALLHRIIATRRQHFALGGIAEIGEAAIVDLQIAAASGVEAMHRLLIGLSEVVVEFLHGRIDAHVDHLAAAAIVQHRGAGDRLLGGLRRVGGEELEVLDMGMVLRADLAGDAGRLGLGLGARELDALIDLDHFHAIELADEVHVPPGAAELAVGDGLEANGLLLIDDLLDLDILDRLQVVGGDLVGEEFLAGVLEGGGAQQRSHMVGAEGGRFAHHDLVSVFGQALAAVGVRSATPSRLARVMASPASAALSP